MGWDAHQEGTGQRAPHARTQGAARTSAASSGFDPVSLPSGWLLRMEPLDAIKREQGRRGNGPFVLVISPALARASHFTMARRSQRGTRNCRKPLSDCLARVAATDCRFLFPPVEWADTTRSAWTLALAPTYGLIHNATSVYPTGDTSPRSELQEKG
jgi:hypothetical protein